MTPRHSDAANGIDQDQKLIPTIFKIVLASVERYEYIIPCCQTDSGLLRDVAQFGSALDWGSRGRWFESSRPDQKLQARLFGVGLFIHVCYSNRFKVNDDNYRSV